MLARPNTLVSILTGTTTDALGDVYDNAGVSASGIPASVLEQSPRNVSLLADDRQQVVRRYTGRISTKYSVTIGNRIRDDRTGAVYVIDNISDSSRTSDHRMDLRRVT